MKKSLKVKKKSDRVKYCGKCLGNIGRGIKHLCVNKYPATRRRKNVKNIVDELPDMQKEQIASSIIREKFESCNSHEKTATISLSTGGSRLNITKANNKAKTNVKISGQHLFNFKRNTRYSRRDMRKLANLFRVELGRNCLPKN